MKKTILSLILLLCLCAALTACTGEHTHSAAEAWNSNDMYHWHACTGKGCKVALGQVPHTWNGGEITKEPTPETEGIKTYTCMVCAYQATEQIAYAPDKTVTE